MRKLVFKNGKGRIVFYLPENLIVKEIIKWVNLLTFQNTIILVITTK